MINSLPLDEIIVFFVSLLIGLSLHEAMHAFTAHWLGDDTAYEAGRLTINPLKHIDFLTTVMLPFVLYLLGLPLLLAAKPVPFNPWNVKFEEFGAALIGLAGPLTNLALAIVASIILRLSGLGAGDQWTEYLLIFISLNVGIFVFNLIPFPPLDGSRVLYAFAPEPLQNFMQSIERMGIGAVLVVFILLFSVLLPIIRTANEFILNILL